MTYWFSAEHAHFVDDDSGCVALYAVFVRPFAGLQSAFDVDLHAFFQIFSCDFS